MSTDPTMGDPPPNGDAMCSSSSGTPRCALTDQKTGTQTWYCGIECGMAGAMNLGTCPTGLTCTSNLCQ